MILIREFCHDNKLYTPYPFCYTDHITYRPVFREKRRSGAFYRILRNQISRRSITQDRRLIDILFSLLFFELSDALT